MHRRDRFYATRGECKRHIEPPFIYDPFFTRGLCFGDFVGL
jgi:hypothetical protein